MSNKAKPTSKGLLIVVSAPAGCGKDTILGCVRDSCRNLHYSVSATTRQIREGEEEGVHYFFKTHEEFEELIKNDKLLEFTEYAGNYYGTPKDFIPKMLEAGKDVVLKIEVEGAANIRRIFPDCVLVFILPPSFDELERRLKKRGSETEETIKKRVNIAETEMSYVKSYDYIIINENLEKATEDFKAVIRAEKLSVKRGTPVID
ncbi:MAG: guanylate kinase [Oscillospiraceae bacterium]|nr:guanylate kinase [Oscillospiraceae bacterium]